MVFGGTLAQSHTAVLYNDPSVASVASVAQAVAYLHARCLNDLSLLDDLPRSPLFRLPHALSWASTQLLVTAYSRLPATMCIMATITITDTKTNKKDSVLEKLEDCGKPTCVYSTAYDKGS